MDTPNPAPTPQATLALHASAEGASAVKTSVALKASRKGGKPKVPAGATQSFLGSKQFLVLILTRAALSLAFMSSGLVFLTIGAVRVLQAPGTAALAASGNGFQLSAVGQGTVLMVCSLVPFLFAYLSRPTVSFGKDGVRTHRRVPTILERWRSPKERVDEEVPYHSSPTRNAPAGSDAAPAPMMGASLHPLGSP